MEELSRQGTLYRPDQVGKEERGKPVTSCEGKEDGVLAVTTADNLGRTLGRVGRISVSERREG